RNLAAHEFRLDESRPRGAEALALGKRGLGALELLLATEVLAFGDIDHFLGDDAGARELQLRHRPAIRCPQRTVRGRKIAREVLAADIAVVDGLDRTSLVVLDPAALLHPFHTC